MKTKPSGQSNMVNAKGKRKEESYGLALSLQDVFSDPANLAGRQQKTSCLSADEAGLSEIGQGNPTQLEGKEKKKVQKANAGGRKKLPIVQFKSKKLQMHVTEQEYFNFRVLLKASGKKTISDFMRVLGLHEKKNNSIINNVALIKHLDVIGKEIGRIGNNINQLAKYANIQILSGKVDQRTMAKFTDQMDSYLKERRELAKVYRALVRNE